MMNDSRLKLHTDLLEILGSNNVYFQPPESIKMKYPAIVYSRSDIENRYAGDNVYNQNFKFKVIVVDYEPDSLIVQKMSKFKYASFDRHYVANGLNHDMFTVNYTKK